MLIFKHIFDQDFTDKMPGILSLLKDLSEKETVYLLKSAAMKKRLVNAKNRTEGIPFDKACEDLGV